MYVSNAIANIQQSDTLDIEKTSLKNNKKALVTGVLTYKNNTFMQFLEGPEHSVKRIFTKIQQDSRHTKLDILRQDTIPQRQFNDWHMKYFSIDDIAFENDLLYNKLFKQRSMRNDAIKFAIETRFIMLAFKQANYSL